MGVDRPGSHGGMVLKIGSLLAGGAIGSAWLFGTFWAFLVLLFQHERNPLERPEFLLVLAGVPVLFGIVTQVARSLWNAKDVVFWMRLGFATVGVLSFMALVASSVGIGV